MVALVSGNNVAKSAYCDRIVVGDTAAGQFVPIQMTEEVDRGRPDRLKLVQEVIHPPVIEATSRYVAVLVETSEWLLVAASEAQRPIREDAFGVAEVANDFLDGPLAGRVRKQTAFVVDPRSIRRLSSC